MPIETHSFTNMDELYEICKRLGIAELHEDNDGQLVIYTGLATVSKPEAIEKSGITEVAKFDDMENAGLLESEDDYDAVRRRMRGN